MSPSYARLLVMWRSGGRGKEDDELYALKWPLGGGMGGMGGMPSLSGPEQNRTSNVSNRQKGASALYSKTLVITDHLYRREGVPRRT